MIGADELNDEFLAARLLGSCDGSSYSELPRWIPRWISWIGWSVLLVSRQTRTRRTSVDTVGRRSRGRVGDQLHPFAL